MLSASHRTLRTLAALTWLIGGIALFAKGTQLAAILGRADPLWAALAAAAGIAVGALKAKYVFVRFCRRNLDRIAGLEAPRVWQFFRPQFFAALALMIAAGVTLSKLALSSFAMLVFVAALDLSLATALFVSLIAFRRPAGRHE